MNFKNDIKRLLKKEGELDNARGNIESKVQSVCDFNIHLDNVPGDGWCFGSDVSGFPLFMQMKKVLDIVEQTGEFKESDWSPFG